MNLPNPEEYDIARENMAPEEAERIKKLDCKFYERCLDRACRMNWTQFHCGNCHAYQRVYVDIADVECLEPSYSLVTIGRSYGGAS